MPRTNGEFLHIVQVKNLRGGGFPLDMLRYESLYPANSDDSSNIGLSIANAATGDSVEDRGMFYDLKRIADGNWEPNYRRWESFGFSVENHTKQRI